MRTAGIQIEFQPARPSERLSAIRRRRRVAQTAFTLLEVLIVIVLLAIVAAVVWPNFRNMMDAGHLSESSRRFETLFAMCRAEAMNEARIHRIELFEDGTLRVTRQVDPVYAGHIFLPLTTDWADEPILGDGVWIESILPLRDGPTPLEYEPADDRFTAIEGYLEELLSEELIVITQIGPDYAIEFPPDGVTASLRLTLRDRFGRGVHLTYDGRLGRMENEPAAPLPQDRLERPAPVERPEDRWVGMSEADVLAEFLPR